MYKWLIKAKQKTSKKNLCGLNAGLHDSIISATQKWHNTYLPLVVYGDHEIRALIQSWTLKVEEKSRTETPDLIFSEQWYSFQIIYLINSQKSYILRCEPKTQFRWIIYNCKPSIMLDWISNNTFHLFWSFLPSN